MTIDLGGYIMVLTIFSAGIACGAMWNNRYWIKKMKGEGE